MTDRPEPAATPLPMDFEMLKRLAEIAEPHHHALLEAIRAEFGDERAATLHTVALFMLAGNVLLNIPHADRVPDGVAQLWSLMRVAFSLEPKRVQ
jgi:hypothetical protein